MALTDNLPATVNCRNAQGKFTTFFYMLMYYTPATVYLVLFDLDLLIATDILYIWLILTG